MPRHRRVRRHAGRTPDALTEKQLGAVSAALNARTPTGKPTLASQLVMADAGPRERPTAAIRGEGKWGPDAVTGLEGLRGAMREEAIC